MSDTTTTAGETNENESHRPKKWDIQDFGTAEDGNGVWMFCENIDARNNMAVGNTCYLDFKSGMGRDTLRVQRIQ